MKKKGKVLCAVLLCALVLAGAYTAVSAAAGSADPLVTLSYLTGKFTPQMEQKMQTLVNDKAAALTKQFDQALQSAGAGGGTAVPGSANLFSVVTLSKGQVLTGEIGCEVMLRVGGAVCGADDVTGLIDMTGGSNLQNGMALVKNHLYLVTVNTRTVTAAADTVKLLVRGPYTVK